MKTLLSIAFVFALSAANAQRLIGVRGGVNVNNIMNISNGEAETSSSLQSFHVGVMANVPFFIFSFQPGIMVTGKGARITHGDESSATADYFVAETNPFYLEVPATFNINLHFGEAAGMYFGAGPYAAVGIGGKNRVYGRQEGADFAHNDKISFDGEKGTTPEQGGAYSSFNKYDYGATFNAGLFLTRFHVGAFYDQGISKANRISNADQSDNMKLGTLGFSAGFVFGG
jgi:hypothetical protein